MTHVGVVDGAFTSELRRSVLRPGFPVGTPMLGDTDPHAIHVAAVEEGVPVSACVLAPNPYPLHPESPAAWQLRFMATALDFRGRGFGALVVEASFEEVLGHGGRLLWLAARENAIGFYERLGLIAEGPLYIHEETQIPHRRMYRELTPGPTSSAG